MSKLRILTILVLALAILNIGLLVFFFMGKPPYPPKHGPKEGPKEAVIEQLHFSAEQVVAYETIIAKHRNQVEAIEAAMREAKQELYILLPEEDIAAEADSLFAEIATYQAQIEKVHFEHFLEIKALCTPEQRADFAHLSKELGHLFAPKRPPRKE